MILKNLHDKNIIFVNKNVGVYGACQHKTTFRIFYSVLMIPILGERVGTYNGFKVFVF